MILRSSAASSAKMLPQCTSASCLYISKASVSFLRCSHCATVTSHLTSCTLLEQRRTLRNLHQYPKARYKSLVKDRQRFSRSWWLKAANNYELLEEVGHEREALENFAEYRDDSKNDRYILSTNRLEDLPARVRLDTITEMMTNRWKVRDANRGYDKSKMMLQALECFSEMRALGQMTEFDALPEANKDTFLEYVQSCQQFSLNCVHSHPDAVAILIRAAHICDEMRCTDKRDELIRVAEGAARRLEKPYSFARRGESVKLNPLSYDEQKAEKYWNVQTELENRFPNKRWITDPPPDKYFILGARNRKEFIPELPENDYRRKLLQEPHRPESDPWTSNPRPYE